MPKSKVSFVVSNNDSDVNTIADNSKLNRKSLANGMRVINDDNCGNHSSDCNQTDDELIAFNGNDINDNNDNYFTSHSTRVKTSSKTMHKLMQNFDLNQTQINDIIEEQMIQEKSDLKQRFKTNCFNKWIDLMNSGFNVLLYGIGSKRKLLQLFVDNCVESRHLIVIYGYISETSVKSIMNVLNDVLDQSNSDENQLLDEIKKIDFDIYLVIHSIDILCSKNNKFKLFLNKLMRNSSHLHLIASVDHINCGLIWSTSECNAYNFLWFNASTFDSYITEKSYISNKTSIFNCSVKGWKQDVTLSSVQHVYDSLTINAQKIFVLILNHYIKSDSSANGLLFSDCYHQCREEFLVNSEVTLRVQLSEFKDHKLLKLKKSAESGETIVVCIDKSVANLFLENI